MADPAFLFCACVVSAVWARLSGGPALGNGAGHGGPTKCQPERETPRPVVGGGAPSFLRRPGWLPVPRCRCWLPMPPVSSTMITGPAHSLAPSDGQA